MEPGKLYLTGTLTNKNESTVLHVYTIHSAERLIKEKHAFSNNSRYF